MTPLRILSLGAGVQSTCVALMAADGEIAPIAHAIFADTGDEPAAVYEHLEWLKPHLERGGTELHIVTKTRGGIPVASITAETHAVIAGEQPVGSTPPFAIRNAEGKPGTIRRQCTAGFKIVPIEREIKHIIGVAGKRVPEREEPLVEQLFGISWDETQRMRDSRVHWIRNNYPLVDLRMKRSGCVTWMQQHGYPRPPRSACVFCPYRNTADWRELRDNDPEGFQRAIEYDRLIRDGRPFGLDAELFVHYSAVPLEEVDLSSLEDRGQGTLFEGECEGMCGV